jgi:NADP-dependent 3-hydroxy acid dehydrogenase YdfG
MDGMQCWRGKVALVTGATSGIGRAVTTALAQQDIRVAFCGRRLSRIQELEATLASDGHQALGLAADLREVERIEELWDRIHGAWGRVSILVNNAGFGRRSSLIEPDVGRWREMLEVNVLALATCTALAIADMRAEDDLGHVINISSIGAHRHKPGVVGNGMYVASKHAVRSLTESLRIELRECGSRIRVSSISPGLVETEFAEVFDGSREHAHKIYSSIEPLKPDDIANAVLFLLAQPQRSEVRDILITPTQQRE